MPYYQELLPRGNIHSLFHEFDKLHMKIVPLGALQPFFMLESLIFFCCNPQKKLFFFSPRSCPNALLEDGLNLFWSLLWTFNFLFKCVLRSSLIFPYIMIEKWRWTLFTLSFTQNKDRLGKRKCWWYVLYLCWLSDEYNEISIKCWGKLFYLYSFRNYSSQKISPSVIASYFSIVYCNNCKSKW